MRLRFHLVLVSAVLLSLSAIVLNAAAQTTTLAQQATRIEKPGLPNFYKVTETFYRGAQPTAEGMRELKKMGIKTVINLRSSHTDKDEIGDTTLDSVHIRFGAWHPENADVVRFLEIVTDPKRAPVFVHCQHGADRTGMMSAIYRIVVCGWTKDEAIKEMMGGFGFHSVWQNIVRYMRNLDLETLKHKARLPEKDGKAE